MKKFLSLVVSGAIALTTLTAHTAFAREVDASAKLVPADYDILVTLDWKEYKNEYVKNSAREIFTGFVMPADAANLETANTIFEVIETEKVTFAIKDQMVEVDEMMMPMTDFLMMAPMSSTRYANVQNIFAKNNELQVKTSDKTDIYYVGTEYGDEMAFSRYDSHFILSNRSENIAEIIEGTASFASLEDYKETNDMFSDDAFATIQVKAPNYEEQMGMLKMADPTVGMLFEGLIDRSIIAGAGHGAIALYSEGNVITSQEYQKLDSEKLMEAGYDFDGYMPTIPAMVSGDEPMMMLSVPKYMDMGVVLDMLKEEANDELANEIIDNLSFEIEEFFMAVQATEEILPSMTVAMTSTDSEMMAKNMSELEGMLSGFLDLAKPEMEADGVMMTAGETRVNGQTMTKYNFMFEEDGIMFDIDFIFGMVDENTYMITTNSNIANEFGEGLQAPMAMEGDNMHFVLDLGLAMQQLMSAVEMMEMSDDTTKEMMAVFTVLADNLEPMVANSEITNDYVMTRSYLNIDFERIATEAPMIAEAFAFPIDVIKMSAEAQLMANQNMMEQEAMKQMIATGQVYQDVPSDHVHAQDIFELRMAGVLAEKPNFNPEAPLKRSEFTKLAIAAVDMANLGYFSEGDYDATSMYEEMPNEFKDISEDAWFKNFAKRAVELELIGGYADGTFGGGNDITRAEAAQIIFNILEANGVTPVDIIGGNFDDVPEGKWFTNAVNFTTERGFFTAGGNFNPHEAITRGEMAKLINQVISMLQ